LIFSFFWPCLKLKFCFLFFDFGDPAFHNPVSYSTFALSNMGDTPHASLLKQQQAFKSSLKNQPVLPTRQPSVQTSTPRPLSVPQSPAPSQDTSMCYK
jgi:hypothetical protein